MPKGHWKYTGKKPTMKSCVFYKQYICSVYLCFTLKIRGLSEFFSGMMYYIVMMNGLEKTMNSFSFLFT